MPENDDLPESLRCARSDGRKWRCKRRVLAGKKYCQDHLTQFQQKAQKKKHRVELDAKVLRNSQNRNRIVEKSKEVEKGESSRKRSRSASEALDETIRSMKLKKGDIQLELIREYLIRKDEKNKEKELEESESGVRNIIKDFPNGRMEIPPPHGTSQEFDNVGPYNVKLGTNCKTIERRNFRSKNVEPVPVCTMQILPSVNEAVKNKKEKKRRKCHWCRKFSYRILVRCKACQKESFCEDCIEERSFVKEEVRKSCPVCLGTCRCRACLSSKPKDDEHKESIKDTEKIEKLQQLYYLIKMLLPVLKKLNLDHSIELEIEAKIKGARNYEIPQVKLGGKNLICCNCNTSIVDFHRSCTRCSYNLCLSCCHEFRQGKLGGGLKENRIMYPYRKRSCTSDKLPSDRKKNSSVEQVSKLVSSPTLPRNWNVYKDGRICCPPKDFGGCGDNISLDLRCLYPCGWDKELEASVKDIVSKYDSPDSSDLGSCCSLCRKTANQGNRVNLLLETARRDNSNENFLYYPNFQDLHVERLGHFQNHWRKGHPVIVRSVVQVAANMNWDPVTMFCTYLGKSLANSVDSAESKTTNYLDCFEVELSERQIFMGSLEGQTNAFMNQDKVKINGCLFPNIFQKHFPEQYAQLMQFIPLKEYMDPMSGIFNLAAKLPENMPKPNFGPSVHIAYGETEEFMQGHFVTRLSYDSHDVVNILVHATDIPVPKKELNTLKRLLKMCTDQDHSRSTSKAADQPSVNKVLKRTSAFNSERTKGLTGKSSLRSELTEESVFQDRPVIDLNYPDGIAKASTSFGVASRGGARSIRPKKLSGTSDQDHEFDSDVTIFCSGASHRFKDLVNEYSFCDDIEGYSCSKVKPVADSCGAQWDIFRRQDVPQLLEYLRRHCDESIPAYYNPMHVVHPILDNSFYFDAFQKMRLKKEFNIEPWTFEQKTGEAVIIPAGCPYQVKKLKPSVNVILEFISPENALECTRLADEIRSLPFEHKAKEKFREVEKMTLYGISSAIDEVRNLTSAGMASSGKEELTV